MQVQQAQEEKLISKLQWLNERAKRDFKGNPPPFEPRKNRQTVELARKMDHSKRAGDAGFLPFWHGPPNLSQDAVPLRHLHGCDSSKFRNKQRSSHDSSANVHTCLIWNSSPPPPPRTRVPPKPSNTARNDSYSIKCMPPEERAAAYRDILFKHPKVTRESIDAHHDRWSRGTQLGGVMLTH